MKSLAVFKKQFQREMCLLQRQPHLLLHATLFFLMTCIFFPLTLPFDPSLLRSIAPGLLWIAMLFALFLSAVTLFQQDYEQGIIEQWILSGHSLPLIISIKLVVHWIFVLVPILIFSPLLALLFDFSLYETVYLNLALIIGTPALFFFCGFASIFSMGKGMLMACILLPLTIPTLIFGSGGLIAVMQGFSGLAYLAILLAFTLLTLSFLPFAMAGAIRISLVD